MKINKLLSYSESFGAKLIRHEKKEGKYATKKDVIKSYDKQIELIEDQKKRALELDEFMHSKKITKLIEKLPEDDEVRIENTFCFQVNSADNLQRRNHLVGFFHKRDDNDYEMSSLEDTFINAQKKDGSIDKDKIVRYLQEMIKNFH